MIAKGQITASRLGVAGEGFPTGPVNAITDVAGVRVGHCTVTEALRPDVQTGVTVVLPHAGNLFREKVVAACHVINGFGKAMGLMQVAELGVLESPVAITNTLSVPAVTEGLLDHLLAANPEIGTTTGSVNVVVGECNDSYLNDLRGRHVTRSHVAEALAGARGGPVPQGSVGAGRGMSCFGMKGGVGSSSRLVELRSSVVTIGVLAVANLGLLPELVIAGCNVGRELSGERPPRTRGETVDAGSVVVVLATDAPLGDRQLLRCLKRVQNGLARTGSTAAHGSGEVAIGFSTARRIPHWPSEPPPAVPAVNEDGPEMDGLFAATAEATEEAVLNALFNAESVRPKEGRSRDRPFPLERLYELLDAAAARERDGRRRVL